MNKLASIHLIRFIASMGVVVYHFLPGKREGWSGYFINNSNELVNLFFFISGLVLSFSNGEALTSNKVSVKQFYFNRIARLYPSYLLALLTVVTCSMIYHLDLGRTTFLKLPFEALGIQTWLYPGSINFPGWSLSVEMFFYVCFPFIVSNYFKLIEQNLVRAFVLLTAYFSIVLFINYCAGRQDSYLTVALMSKYGNFLSYLPSYIEYHPILRIGYFVTGILSYFLIFRTNGKLYDFVKNNKHLLLLFSLLGIVLIMSHSGKTLEPYLRSGSLAPLYVVLFMSLAMLDNKTQSLLSNKVFVFLGAISYGIYIFQYPMQLIYENSFHLIDSKLHFILYSLFLMATCAIIYLYFESILNKWIRDKWR